ncbi:hypothetical protein BJ165DRAFT_1434698 [Panaeolus papilionaceus]|nr:hypothetical protein BJ165DRAFT_1434698 [Panaeolus papilionaceus]
MFSKQLYFLVLSLALFANAIPQLQPRQSKCGVRRSFSDQISIQFNLILPFHTAGQHNQADRHRNRTCAAHSCPRKRR